MGLLLRPHSLLATTLNYPNLQGGTTTDSTSYPLPTGLRATASICHTEQPLTHCLPQHQHLSPAPQLDLGRR